MGTATKPGRIVSQNVGPNLYRLESTGGYYALLKKGAKQFRRSLKTKDRKLAERRLAELRDKVGGLTTSEEGRATFEKLSRRWLELARPSMKPNAWLRKESCVKGLTPFFAGAVVRNITAVQCERWLAERGAKLSASSFVQELGALNGIFEYAAEQGIVLKNPAGSIKRRRVVQSPIVIPTRDQFRKLIETIRESDGRTLSRKLAAPGADLVELLAYSGCRIAEATALTWADADFAKNTLTITGGEQGTKNREFRVVPMTGALRGLLERLTADRSPKPEERIAQIGDAKRCLARACRQLGLPKFSHHDFRHFFATTCIESGVDIPTVSRWLGHKDRGALAMRVYGHLRLEHSRQAAGLVRF